MTTLSHDGNMQPSYSILDLFIESCFFSLPTTELPTEFRSETWNWHKYLMYGFMAAGAIFADSLFFLFATRHDISKQKHIYVRS